MFSKGVLKDYLRELPSPLITKQLYEAVLDTMAKNPLKMSSSGCENDPSDSKHTVDLLDCLPDVEKVNICGMPFFPKSQLMNRYLAPELQIIFQLFYICGTMSLSSAFY